MAEVTFDQVLQESPFYDHPKAYDYPKIWDYPKGDIGMADLNFTDDAGTKISISGSQEAVMGYAAKLQGGAQQDTLGKLLSGADGNEELIQTIAKSLGYEKFNASKTLGVLSLLKKFL